MSKEINVKDMLASILEIEKEKINIDMEEASTPEWDSLAQVAILAKLEEELDVVISAKEASELTSVSKIVETIKNNEGTVSDL